MYLGMYFGHREKAQLVGAPRLEGLTTDSHYQVLFPGRRGLDTGFILKIINRICIAAIGSFDLKVILHPFSNFCL